MDLEPGDGGTRRQELADVRGPQPDAGPRRKSALPVHGVHAVPEGSGPWLGAAADQLLAGPGRHVDPRVLLAIAARGARAGGVGRLAVILARLRDAVALLRLELGLGRRAGLAVGDERHGESGDHGRRGGQVLLHFTLLLD